MEALFMSIYGIRTIKQSLLEPNAFQKAPDSAELLWTK
jgi:hypothetical protein